MNFICIGYSFWLMYLMFFSREVAYICIYMSLRFSVVKLSIPAADK